MRAVTTPTPGGPDALVVAEVPDPVAGPGEVVLRVAASAVNRADLLQRQGHYPPPPGASEVIGLECSGTVLALGEGVTTVAVGDEVCALLAGGGYAEQVAVPAGQVMPIPEGVSLLEAAALPEVVCTVWSNVFMTAGLAPGETLLVHGGTGGIGTMAIQLGKAYGARVVTTVGSAEKAEFARSLGADVTIDYRTEDFAEIVRGLGGADVILDNMGAKYLAGNVRALARKGRLVVIGLQGGTRAELDLNALMRTCASVTGTTLRARPLEEKAAVCADVVRSVWPLVENGTIRPVVSATYPLDRVADAHRAIEAGEQRGKILLTT